MTKPIKEQIREMEQSSKLPPIPAVKLLAKGLFDEIVHGENQEDDALRHTLVNILTYATEIQRRALELLN